ncbi:MULTISPECIES: alpha/beta hydrolase [Pseudofrankia]|uniref:alpha/beta hydrolase n=1 Tax=Pseudofrankia TaxID=2994363 RepID=UPI000234C891|nr:MULTISPECIES: alpha/beta hydrolase [Pseudofrankia]OHV31656.1 esterase [Pseudofrankia sp. EUN1h]
MPNSAHDPVLEPAARAFVEDAAKSLDPRHVSLAERRRWLDEIQSGPALAPAVDTRELTIPCGPAAAGVTVGVRIVRPIGVTGRLPVVLYLHGCWVMGDANTHARLVAELAVGVQAAVVFPEFDRAPEARYPAAVHQCFAAARWVAEHGADNGLDVENIAVAGDGGGGGLAAAVTLLAKEHGGPRLAAQVLFCPVTDADVDTPSYQRFANGYVLSRDLMRWSWDQYAPDEASRAEILASPLRAGLETLADLPPALVITAEADVLRDEGEAYAARLGQAGVTVTAVRYIGIVHGFVVLNALRSTCAADAAIAQAIFFLRRALAV